MTAPDQCCSSVRKFLPRRRPHMTQSGQGMGDAVDEVDGIDKGIPGAISPVDRTAHN